MEKGPQQQEQQQLKEASGHLPEPKYNAILPRCGNVDDDEETPLLRSTESTVHKGDDEDEMERQKQKLQQQQQQQQQQQG